MTELSHEAFNTLTAELLERMDEQLGKWADEEPEDIWWSEQRDFKQAFETIQVLMERPSPRTTDIAEDAR